MLVAFLVMADTSLVAKAYERSGSSTLVAVVIGAGAVLKSVLAFVWYRSRVGLAARRRLYRGLAGWLAGLAVLGVVLGSIADGVGDMVRDNQRLRYVFARMGGPGGLIDAYLAGVLGLIAAAYSIQAVGGDQPVGRAGAGHRSEPAVLGEEPPRLRDPGPAAALATAGLTAGLTHGLNTGDIGRELPRALGAVMVQLPAIWVLAATAVALIDLLPDSRPSAGSSWRYACSSAWSAPPYSSANGS